LINGHTPFEVLHSIVSAHQALDAGFLVVAIAISSFISRDHSSADGVIILQLLLLVAREYLQTKSVDHL